MRSPRCEQLVEARAAVGDARARAARDARLVAVARHADDVLDSEWVRSEDDSR